MEITQHFIGNISAWYGAMAFLRTIASAGFIPFSNEGITYDAKTRRTDNLRELNEELWLKPVHESEKQYFNRQELVAVDSDIIETDFRMDTGEYTHTKQARSKNGKYTVTEKMKLINFDMFAGGSANDSVYGSDNGDVIWGGEGQNYINGKRGNDTIYFGRGNDIVVGGEGRSDFAIGFDGFSSRDAVELIEITRPSEINGIYLRDSGRYVVVENDNGRKTYVHESTENIKNFQASHSLSFQDLWEAVRLEVRDPNQEATREYFLMGTDKSEDFYGGEGRDNITGNGGIDKFHQDVFDRNSNSWANMDRILDFDSNDKIVIHSSLLGINPDDAGFEIVSTTQERRIAMSIEDVHFAYDTRSGDMFWDSNGANGGGGKGLVKLVGDSAFSGANQIEFV